MMTGPISVVVPLFSDSRSYVNRLPLQRRQWISLQNQTDKNFELIGVDNQSHDDVLGVMREYFPGAVGFRHEVPKNTVGARVEAVRRATHPYVVTLDSECVVYPHFIENWKKFVIANPGVVGVGGLSWYDGIILSGREFILGNFPKEEIDYTKLEIFLRKISPSSRPLCPIPPSILKDDQGPPRWEPYNWASGFYYTNASFPKEVYIQAGAPDADLTGYGHDDTLFGLRLKAMKTAVKFVHGVPVIHQCHRGSHATDASGPEDIKTAHEHAERVGRLAKELSG